MKVSISTIADSLQLSRSTVSRALRGMECIPEATRRKVAARAAELGYTPDQRLSMLARHRWKGGVPAEMLRIAFLQDSSWRQFVAEWFLAPARACAEENGLSLEPLDLGAFRDAGEAGRHLRENRFLGLLVTPVLDPRNVLMRQLPFHEFPAVSCALGYSIPGIHVVQSDTLNNTEMIWRRLAGMGFRRIGCALYCKDPRTEDDWKRIMMSRTMIEHLGLEEAARIPFNHAHPMDWESLAEWYERHRPEVIIGFNPETYRSLVKAGIRIPEDTAFACFHATPNDPCSGIANDQERIAQTAMALLVSEIQNTSAGLPQYAKTVLLEPVWKAGNTLFRGQIA